MRRNKRSFLERTFLFLNHLAVICLLLAYLATIIDPAKFWCPAMFGLAYPFILLVNVIFIIFWLLYRRWWFLYSLLFILLGYQPLTRTLGFRTASSSDFNADSATIKLMSYNVHQFKRFGSVSDTTTKSDVLNLIRTEQPDIIGFEEFFSRKKGRFDLKDSVLKILNTKQYSYSKAADNDFESTGVAVFSKYPIVNSGDIDFLDTTGGNRGVWIDVEKSGKVFRVFGVHLASISFRPEDYSFVNDVKSDINTGKDVQSSKRIVKRLKDAFIRRSKQVKILKQLLSECKTPYILMGDFNDTPVSYTLTQLSKNLKNGFKEKGRGLGVTYNGDFPNFQIDYILASPQFDFKGYKIIKKSYSDHYPLRADIVLHP